MITTNPEIPTGRWHRSLFSLIQSLIGSGSSLRHYLLSRKPGMQIVCILFWCIWNMWFPRSPRPCQVQLYIATPETFIDWRDVNMLRWKRKLSWLTNKAVSCSLLFAVNSDIWNRLFSSTSSLIFWEGYARGMFHLLTYLQGLYYIWGQVIAKWQESWQFY